MSRIHYSTSILYLNMLKLIYRKYVNKNILNEIIHSYKIVILVYLKVS